MEHPTIDDIKAAAQKLEGLVAKTPAWPWPASMAAGRFDHDGDVILKLELFQHTGSFKVRAALLNMMALSPEELERGVTAVSAGNHAAAVAFAATRTGSSAKVVMPRNADPFRVDLCRSLGAEVVLVKDVHQAFITAGEVQEKEGRSFVHPFEGPQVALGTGTLGMEFYRQAQYLDVVVIPIGGGGLCAGVSCAIKQLNPECHVIGVEPEGADTMHRSFASGQPESIESVQTIADSLGAPYALEYSFSMCRTFVDELVKVDDPALCASMRSLFTDLKLAVEPAGAAATAALEGPLRGRFRGKRTGLIVCGANISPENFCRYTGG